MSKKFKKWERERERERELPQCLRNERKMDPPITIKYKARLDWINLSTNSEPIKYRAKLETRLANPSLLLFFSDFCVFERERERERVGDGKVAEKKLRETE